MTVFEELLEENLLLSEEVITKSPLLADPIGQRFNQIYTHALIKSNKEINIRGYVMNVLYEIIQIHSNLLSNKSRYLKELIKDLILSMFQKGKEILV